MFSNQEHPSRSYYAATANPHGSWPRLTESIRADVCVVGGGFTGLTAALNLAENGFKVALIEANRIGWGASGRNGGQINTGLRKSPQALIARFGKARGKALFDLAEEARAIIWERVEKHGIRCDLRHGNMLLASKPGDLSWMEEEIACLEREMHYDKAKLLDRNAIRSEIASDLYHGGIKDSGGGHLHPLNYALGLAEACKAAGVQLFEHTAATKIEDSGAKVTVTTDAGRIEADHAVLGCNAYLGGLEPRIAGKIMPIANFVIATEPMPEAEARALIPSGSCACDTKFVVSYYRVTADNRMLFGGGERYSTAEPSDIPGFVQPYMLDVFPQLKAKRIDYGWGGMLAITMLRLPQLGRIGRIYYAHGYSGMGVAITGIAGKLIAEAMAGTAERFDVFSRIEHKTFPGGTLLRHPLLVLAMLWYVLRDKLP
ncbi:NAD(P)/FAD-dependent oxidoreductase [Dongia sedimenti]|uniref:FAD-binding oxidoreductase n=1 Tax=Dongia sedimenti TaxID=3064282 RepID=A0ABU0YQ48_9PROT|nr:FAD-binding oxidoreductase [Rhodospirillaceae bacterium R-7]